MTSRRGYLYGLIALAAGLATLALMIWRLNGQIDRLTRIPVPGTSVVSLPAGETIGYGEPPADAVGEISIAARCNAVAADGSKIELGTPSATVSYDFGSHRGVSILKLNLPQASKVTLTCTAEDPFILALGAGIGSSILVGVLAVFGGFIVALVLIIRTWIARRRDKKRAAAFPAEMP